METMCFSEKLASIDKSTRRQNPEEHHHLPHRRVNLKSQKNRSRKNENLWHFSREYMVIEEKVLKYVRYFVFIVEENEEMERARRNVYEDYHGIKVLTGR
jgi:hypothetical protein